MDTLVTTRKGVEYVVRWYEAGDGEGFCSLLETVTGSDRDVDWFERLYVDNPYVDHVPLVVAEADGDIVGTRPFSAYGVRAGGSTELALLTRDTMVHPDHRRRGLFTTMTERALERYTEGDPIFAFSHSNENSRPGYRKMGWRYLGQRQKNDRIQRPGAFLESKTRDSFSRVLVPTAGAAARAYLRRKDRRASVPSDVEVDREDAVPDALLASLYERRPPDAIHPVRDEAYFRWRYAVPGYDAASTYVARRGGESVAAMVVHRARGPRDLTWTMVDEVLPMAGGPQWRGALSALLARVIAESEDDVVRVPDSIVPSVLLAERGFLDSHRLPLSVFSGHPLELGVRPLTGDDEEVLDGRAVEAAVPFLWSVA